MFYNAFINLFAVRTRNGTFLLISMFIIIDLVLVFTIESLMDTRVKEISLVTHFIIRPLGNYIKSIISMKIKTMLVRSPDIVNMVFHHCSRRLICYTVTNIPHWQMQPLDSCGLTGIRSWISNHSHVIHYDALLIYTLVNNSLINPPLK